MWAVSEARNVLTKILEGHMTEDLITHIAAADQYVDDALDLLEYEEPTLMQWLENDRNTSAFKASMTAIYILLLKNRSAEACAEQIGQVLTRLLYATSAEAVLSQRAKGLL